MTGAQGLRNRLVAVIVWAVLSVGWAGTWAWEVAGSLTPDPVGRIDEASYPVALAMLIVGIVSGVAALTAIVVTAVLIHRSPDGPSDEPPPLIAAINEIGTKHWPYGGDRRRG